jgi:ABC-2 type transport system ATP-binding protein
MKMITGFLAPSDGSITVCGHDVASAALAVKKVIGYLPEGAPAYGDMTPRSFLAFIADMRDLRGREKDIAIDKAIAKTHLESVVNKPIDTVSKGFKRRVGLAQAILHDPQVLILDEPTDGLDPNQKHEVRELLKAMAQDKAIIISTHILEEVNAVCSRAIIIAQGKLLFDGTPAELEALSPVRQAVSLVLSGASKDTTTSKLKNLNGVSKVDCTPRDAALQFMVTPKNGQSIINEVAALCRSESWNVAEMHVEPVHLDEVFRQITSASVSAEGART